MSENPANGSSGGWQRVTSSYQRGDALTEGTYALVSKNGAVRALVETAALIIQVALSRGFDSTSGYLLELVASAEKGMVGVIPVPVTAATPSTVAVRWYKGKGRPQCSFHIGGSFKQYKALALTADAKCQVGLDTAEDGLPMLVIAVKSGLSTRTQTAAGENPVA